MNLREEDAEDDPARENSDGHLGQDVGDERDQGKNRPGGRGEPSLQELRHGEDHRPRIERHHDPAEHEETPGVQLVMGHGDAVGRAGSGQPDQVFRPDVRGKNGSADDEPAQVAPRQEVVRRGPLFLAHDPPGQSEDDPEVGDDNDPINGFYDSHIFSFPVRSRDRFCFTSQRRG